MLKKENVLKERYALVKFAPYTCEYTFKCDKNVKKGNIVRVLVHGYKKPQEVIVSKIKYLSDDELPVSKDRIKSVLSVVCEKDENNRFYENLDEKYAFKKDTNVEKLWKKEKRREVYCDDLDDMMYKYTLTSKKNDAKLSLFSDGSKFVIVGYVDRWDIDYVHKIKTKCWSIQEAEYILNKIKVAVYNYYFEDDEYYLGNILSCFS